MAVVMGDSKYLLLDEYQVRNAKLQEIQKMGVTLYPNVSIENQDIHYVLSHYSDLRASCEEAINNQTDSIKIAGRLILYRSMGKNVFVHIQEGIEKIQVMFNRGNTWVDGLLEQDAKAHHLFLEKKIHIGDFLAIEGNVFRTIKGELTILAKKVTLLCKSLLPLPEKHFGLVNKEVRYRKRWLDLISSRKVMHTFLLRSQIVAEIRKYFMEEDFIEVETPILQNIYGGAEARPFKTYLHDLHEEMYLRIALEVSLKKLIVGGLPRVFEMAKVFRNEGIDMTHNPEFTMFECYAAYRDYFDMMVWMENLCAHLAKKLFGSTKIGIRRDKQGNDHEIDLKVPWIRMSMLESVEKYAGVCVCNCSIEELRDFLQNKSNVQESKALSSMSRGMIVAKIFEECVEPFLIQPHFIVDYPIETTPFAKLHRNPDLAKQGFVERFEGFVLGRELCNAYTELNDPFLQRELLEGQDQLFRSGNTEANPLDEDFLEAILQGFPPCGGLGFGVDRLVMLLTGAHSIRDVLYFPLTKKISSHHQSK